MEKYTKSILQNVEGGNRTAEEVEQIRRDYENLYIQSGAGSLEGDYYQSFLEASIILQSRQRRKRSSW